MMKLYMISNSINGIESRSATRTFLFYLILGEDTYHLLLPSIFIICQHMWWVVITVGHPGEYEAGPDPTPGNPYT
jgi:hypothetical protein